MIENGFYTSTPPASARVRPRVEQVAQGVAHQVQRQHDDEDGEPGQKHHVWARQDSLTTGAMSCGTLWLEDLPWCCTRSTQVTRWRSPPEHNDGRA